MRSLSKTRWLRPRKSLTSMDSPKMNTTHPLVWSIRPWTYGRNTLSTLVCPNMTTSLSDGLTASWCDSCLRVMSLGLVSDPSLNRISAESTFKEALKGEQMVSPSQHQPWTISSGRWVCELTPHLRTEQCSLSLDLRRLRRRVYWIKS
jgi:hypothetical protein